MDRITENAVTLSKEINWFAQVLSVRFSQYFQNEVAFDSIYEIPLPDYNTHDTYYADFIRQNNLRFEERFVIIMALIPSISPAILDAVFVKNPETGRVFTGIRGKKGTTYNGYLPTIETIMFMLSEGDFGKRFHLNRMFEEDHLFQRKSLLKIGRVGLEDPYTSASISISQDFREAVSTGSYNLPKFGAEFPAKLIQTSQEWSDLILEDQVFTALDELHTFVNCGEVLIED